MSLCSCDWCRVKRLVRGEVMTNDPLRDAIQRAIRDSGLKYVLELVYASVLDEAEEIQQSSWERHVNEKLAWLIEISGDE